MQLNVRAFALAFALWWGVGLFFLTWWMLAVGHVTGEATLIGQFYYGYTVSPLGSIIGLVWGLVDGAIGGAILAWLYNLLARRLGGPAG